MTDIYDQATAIEEMQRQHAIDQQRGTTDGPDLRYSHCIDCGEAIDSARRHAVRNCRRCIECAQLAENLPRHAKQ